MHAESAAGGLAKPRACERGYSQKLTFSEKHQDDSWLLSRGAFNIELRLKRAKAAKADPAKQEESSENEVDALTFMQTVVMSFVRGMTHGEQTLPINDLFAYSRVEALCVQVLHKSP